MTPSHHSCNFHEIKSHTRFRSRPTKTSFTRYSIFGIATSTRCLLRTLEIPLGENDILLSMIGMKVIIDQHQGPWFKLQRCRIDLSEDSNPMIDQKLFTLFDCKLKFLVFLPSSCHKFKIIFYFNETKATGVIYQHLFVSTSTSQSLWYFKIRHQLPVLKIIKCRISMVYIGS